MNRKIIWTLVTILALGIVSPAWADESALEKRVASLEREVAVLKRLLEIKEGEAAKKAPEAPVVTANSKDGFSIKSPDGDFKLRVKGYLQLDARYFTDSGKDLGTTDTFVARHVRPIFEGTVYKDFDYYIALDAGNNSILLPDAYIDYKRAPEMKFRAGKFKEPFSLEVLQSDLYGTFPERGLTALLAPNRDVGVMLHGEIREGLVTYQVGGFNGVADGSSSPDADINNDKDLAARIFAHPFKEFDFAPLKGFGAGFALTAGHHEGSTIPTYKSVGQATAFSYTSGTTADGRVTRVSPQFYYYWGPFGLMGDYVESTQDVTRSLVSKRLDNDAWQLVGMFVLTGEDSSYKGVDPRRPFDPSRGDWGALQLVGRYGELAVDEDAFDLGFASRNASVSAIREWGIGFNWYLNRFVKLSLDYLRSAFDDGAPAGEDRRDESLVLGRAQLQF